MNASARGRLAGAPTIAARERQLSRRASESGGGWLGCASRAWSLRSNPALISTSEVAAALTNSQSSATVCGAKPSRRCSGKLSGVEGGASDDPVIAVGEVRRKWVLGVVGKEHRRPPTPNPGDQLPAQGTGVFDLPVRVPIETVLELTVEVVSRNKVLQRDRWQSSEDPFLGPLLTDPHGRSVPP